MLAESISWRDSTPIARSKLGIETLCFTAASTHSQRVLIIGVERQKIKRFSAFQREMAVLRKCASPSIPAFVRASLAAKAVKDGGVC